MLVIGIGNPLRGDDGVGWRLLEELEEAQPRTGVRLRRVQQLTPELAAELAGVQRALFVDAWLAPEGAEPLLRPVAAPLAGGGMDSHRLEPLTVLALAQHLFRSRPAAWELLVPASCFSHGCVFSASLREGLPAARRLLRRWLAG
jgi:hydrogenase maturation protease